jgi:hypothetical protein
MLAGRVGGPYAELELERHEHSMRSEPGNRPDPLSGSAAVLASLLLTPFADHHADLKVVIAGPVYILNKVSTAGLLELPRLVFDTVGRLHWDHQEASSSLRQGHDQLLQGFNCKEGAHAWARLYRRPSVPVSSRFWPSGFRLECFQESSI